MYPLENKSIVHFKVQVSDDFENWRDCEGVYNDLPSAENAAFDLASCSMWSSTRVLRVESSVCNEFLSLAHRHSVAFI